MIFLMISCFSFILLSKSFPHSFCGMGLSSLAFFLREISQFAMSWFRKYMILITSFRVFEFIWSLKNGANLEEGNVEEKGEISLLDLPELALECVLERLSPADLLTMAGVCSSLRERCTSDHIWERHMKPKWGRLIGDIAYREWQCHIALKQRSTISNGTKKKTLFGNVSSLWPLMCNKSKSKPESSFPADSVMAWYLALETGKFWFPAQVYNRENGHVGFMMSCYDAELCYNCSTDTFKARFSQHPRGTTEENIEWDRLRAPAVDIPARVLHASDCLDDLKPGDHIEIQWRRTEEFPYGWWYGVVGHLRPCDGSKNHCQCHSSDRILLEFKQYKAGSRWRVTAINRKDHRQIGNEADGFYGGIRKLYHEDEISAWKRFSPIKVVE